MTYTSGLPIEGLEQPESTLVVQVKSYGGEHWETSALQQLKTAITKFNASAGLLITTAEKTEHLEQALVALGVDTDLNGKPISIIAGPDVARFMLRHAGSLFLGQR